MKFCFFFPQKAPSAPSFIHFSELTTTSVNVSWGEPRQANGIIEGYRLVYEPCTPIDGEKLCLEPQTGVHRRSVVTFLGCFFLFFSGLISGLFPKPSALTRAAYAPALI